MIVDVMRLVLEWLSDPVTGVNAQLAAVPRDPGEDPPPAVVIYNELDHPWVARNVISRDALKDMAGNPQPGLILRGPPSDQPILAAVLPQQQQANPVIIPLGLMYASRKPVAQTSAAQVRDARQTMRAAFRVIARKFDGPHTTYVRNDCVVGLTSEGLALANKYVDAGDDEVLDSLLLPFTVLDRWALGIT